MAFFARPNLDNTQFKQLEGSELTLSGQTQIATTSGLTLTDGSGGNIILTASGASTNFDVLTYCDGIISLKTPTSSGGTGIYTYSALTSCAVGGLPINQDLYGDSLVDIIHCMVSPTLPPTLGSVCISSYGIVPNCYSYEVGSSISNFCMTTAFQPGTISPVYSPRPSGDTCRSDGIRCYEYGFQGTTCYNNGPLPPTDFYSWGSVSVNAGNNCLSWKVYYCSGTTVYDSSGTPFNTLVESATTTCEASIVGYYPWFWGTGTTAPDVSTSGSTQLLINSYTCKCAANSNGVIGVQNFGVTNKYIWFATPATSSSKTCWQGANNLSNNGVIPGALFPAICSWNIVSPESCWGSTCYKIYVSDYPTSINYGMTFCN